MLICATCGTELTCVKTGMDALVDEHYGYRGDLFECKNCDFKIAQCNDHGVHKNEPYKRDKWTVDLKG